MKYIHESTKVLEQKGGYYRIQKSTYNVGNNANKRAAKEAAKGKKK